MPGVEAIGHFLFHGSELIPASRSIVGKAKRARMPDTVQTRLGPRRSWRHTQMNLRPATSRQDFEATLLGGRSTTPDNGGRQPGVGRS
jgi:hypothetical protein